MKYLACAILLPIGLLPLAALGQDKSKKDKFACDIIYVPTDPKIVDKMLEMAKVTKDDIVFDLGCGDGRIICTAAKRHGAKGVGVDIDPPRIRDCKKTMEQMGLTKEQVEIRQGDALKVKDLERATVVMLYMLPEFMAKLEPQLKRLKPGARVVAHDYPFPNTKPDQSVEMTLAPNERAHFVYLWTIREPKK
jgi:cyclopropane fatty-acyl-phospholipid synthase-like methyltransferase